MSELVIMVEGKEKVVRSEISLGFGVGEVERIVGMVFGSGVMKGKKLRRLIRGGKVEGCRKVFGRWVIDEDGVDKLLRDISSGGKKGGEG